MYGKNDVMESFIFDFSSISYDFSNNLKVQSHKFQHSAIIGKIKCLKAFFSTFF